MVKFESKEEAVDALYSRDNRLPRTDFSGLDLSNVDFSGADLCHANFTGANLYQADLSNCDLDDANFSFANLCFANLDDSSLRSAHFCHANLSHAKLRRVDGRFLLATYANLCHAEIEAYLPEANFTSANLAFTKFINSDLRFAFLQSTQCDNAKFNSCDLTWTRLCHSNLMHSTFTNCNVTLTSFLEIGNANHVEFSGNYLIANADFELIAFVPDIPRYLRIGSTIIEIAQPYITINGTNRTINDWIYGDRFNLDEGWFFAKHKETILAAAKEYGCYVE